MIIIDTFIIFALAKRKRDVAQLVARHVRDVEAAGSSPVISTKIERAGFQCVFLFEVTWNLTGDFTEILPFSQNNIAQYNLYGICQAILPFYFYLSRWNFFNPSSPNGRKS